MPDVRVSWQRSPSHVTSYEVVWEINGRSLPAYTVTPTEAEDASEYSLLLSTSDPGLALQPHDSVSVTVTAIGPGGSSAAVASSPASVTIPEPPPAPVQGVTLTVIT